MTSLTCALDDVTGPLQSDGARPRRAAADLHVAVGTALSARDSGTGERRTIGVSDRVRGVDQQRTRRV